ncbi:ATP-grasp domain-containing protein [Lentzea sp. NPDC051838]|uniref:preATP grasp domain-containing protein n=1 Tax=Lentzea sp. NPDC051838 TaxID=3154849 RepID=UPI00342C1854
MTSDYLRAIKAALTGSPATPLALVCNFEAEARWATNHVGLPAAALSASTDVVRRMEQLGALLAGPDDVLIASHDLDPGFRRYAEELGFSLPEVLVPSRTGGSTTENAIGSPELLKALHGRQLLPMGTTVDEEKLADAAGIPLAVPSADVFERVNGKIYGRRLVEDTGLRPVPGHTVESVAEFDSTLHGVSGTVVVKDSYGVSGKGLVVLDSPAKVQGLRKLVHRRASRTGDDRLHVVVEHWLPKRCDLNYQFTLARDGSVTFDFVKQALTEHGVHKGHIMPAELTETQHEELRHAADVVGARLHRDGFHGVAGVDAIVGVDEVLYPVLEINARLNMSTYQGGVVERLVPPGHTCLARHYPIGDSGFADVRRVLPRDVVVTCFGTAAAGRLYTMSFAPDRASLEALDAATTTALESL